MDSENSDLIKIPADVVLLCKHVPAEVFMKLGPQNYIIIAKEGPREQFTEFNLEDKVKLGAELYVRKTDYRKFTQAQIETANEIFKSSKIQSKDKVNVLVKVADSVFNTVEHLGFNHETFNHARFVSQSMLKMIENEDSLSSMIHSLSLVSDELIRHALSVSAVSVMIAQNKGWNNPTILEKISLGALLHDIGLKEYDKEFLSKPRAEYTAADADHYEKHCFRGVEIMRTVSSVPQEVMAIIFEHHENSIGQGYPRSLRDMRLHPFSKVVALADTFCELTIQSTMYPQVMTSEQALDYIENSMGQPFNREVFLALKNLIQTGIKKVPIKIVS